MSVAVPTYTEQWAAYQAICDEIAITPRCEYDTAHRSRTTGCRWHDLDTRAGQLERDLDRMARLGKGGPAVEQRAVTVYVDPETFERLNEWARSRSYTLSEAAIEMLGRQLDESELYDQDRDQQRRAEMAR
jgi:hypothetical protein